MGTQQGCAEMPQMQNGMYFDDLHGIGLYLL